MKSIEDCRKEIDSIDRKLVELLVQRMYLANDVAAYKKSEHMPVYDEEREKALLKRLRILAGTQYESSIMAIYETILMESKKRQMDIIS